jgi:hypothetical protein
VSEIVGTGVGATARLKNGEVRTWESSVDGALGNGTNGEPEHAEQNTPVPVSPLMAGHGIARGRWQANTAYGVNEGVGVQWAVAPTSRSKQ